uniref:Uncharacterized protein n=1 Tax=Anguilla anguilla TaxID=7936 RepID=A0A0E9TZG9_ANGAN
MFDLDDIAVQVDHPTACTVY